MEREASSPDNGLFVHLYL